MIRVLAPEVIDRIAAGEVLDRPANLVKELVENSLDAGATQVDIEFEAGGRRISVGDNGCGMSREDLKLALTRHATSKISASEDLFKLSSYGFRGEAMASIAAVSRMSIISRPRGLKDGSRLQSDFGAMNEPTQTAAREGTEVRIDELFENVPARLKFLKSEPAEHGQIKTTIRALAMAHEAVGFSVRAKGQLLFHWPQGQSFKERVSNVLENDSMFEGSYELEGMRAQVLVSSPQETANVNRNMWFFVQERWIQDRSLSAAVMEAYRNLLMHGEYPTVVVRLTLPPEDVDVNVHPTKSQVKFRDSKLAFRVVSRAIRSVLEKAPWLEGLNSGLGQPAAGIRSGSGSGNWVGAGGFGLESESAQENLSFGGSDFQRTQYQKKVFASSEVREPVRNYAPQVSGESVSVAVPASGFRWADLQVIGQLNQTYIVAQNNDGMILVDQHAAHERVVFERLMESFKSGKMEIQNLLMPLVFDFTADEVESLIREKDQIEKLGLALERMGPESIAVQAIPMMVKESAVSSALKKLAHELSENTGERAWERALGDIFASMACHSVVRAGQTLSSEEMTSLLVQMDHYPLSSFCPHGRPVFIKRRFSEIDREFGRIV